MARHLILENAKNESIDLYTDNGIRLMAVEGLSFDGEIITNKMYASDSERYQMTNLSRRLVNITVRYRGPVHRHEEHKKRITDMLANKEIVRIKYITDITDVYIDGYVEQVDTPPNRRPLNTQISIICPDPYFIRNDSGKNIISGTHKLWKFPLSIEDDKKMMFGQISDSVFANVINAGAVAVGGVFEFVAKTKCSYPKLTNVKTGEFIGVDLHMETGDKLVFDTNLGHKSILLIRADGTETNVFNLRPYNMTWLQLRRGDNILRFSFDSGDMNACDITVYFKTVIGAI